MPIYVYKAKKGPTEIINGELTAENEDQAVNQLDQMGVIPISIVEKTTQSAPNKKKEIKPVKITKKVETKAQASRSIKVKTKDVDTFTRQLASLTRASVPMLRSLSLIAQQTESASLKVVVIDIGKQIKDGKTLSESLARYPQIFNNLYLSLIKSGEQAGVLDEVLFKLADYQEKEQAIRRKIQAALAYPSVMLFVGVGTVFVMITFFLPKFVGIFENMKQELPMPTKILIGLSSFMNAHWYWFLLVIVCILVVLGRGKKSGKIKLIVDAVKLNMPFVKKFVRDSEIARFSRTLGLLLKNGLPVYDSLSLATSTLDNEALRGPLSQVGKEIIDQGSTLSASLDKAKIFPVFAVNMIAVGEEGGKLEESLNEIASSYEREVEQAINIMASMLEPLLILFIGGIVGFIVFAMLLPIFDIGLSGG